MIGIFLIFLGALFYSLELSREVAYLHFAVGTLCIVWTILSRRNTQAMSTGSLLLPAMLSGLGVAIVCYLPFHFIPTFFDLSPGEKFSLSPKALSVLGELDAPLSLLQIDVGDTKQIRNERDVIQRFMRERPEIFTLSSLDPLRDFSLVQKYNLKRDDRLVVVGGSGEKSTNSFTTLREVNEQSLVSAFLRLQQKSEPVISYVTGHGELELLSKEPNGLSRAHELFKRVGAVVEETDLATLADGKLSSAATFIVGPKKRFEAEDQKVLLDYLRSGGTVVYAADAGSETVLENVLTPTGISVSPEPLVRLHEGASGERQLSLDLPLQLYRKHAITSLLTGQASLLFSKAVALKTKPYDSSLVKSVQEIFSYNRLPLGVVVEWNSGGRLFVVGDASWLANAFISRAFNGELAEGLMLWASGVDGFGVKAPSLLASKQVVKEVPGNLLNQLLLLFLLLGECVVLIGVSIVSIRRYRAYQTRLRYSSKV